MQTSMYRISSDFFQIALVAVCVTSRREFHKPVFRCAMNMPVKVGNKFTYAETVTDRRIPARPSVSQRFHGKRPAFYRIAVTHFNCSTSSLSGLLPNK
jgi:hypothetical protein